jgi:hypothetical protein
LTSSTPSVTEKERRRRQALTTRAAETDTQETVMKRVTKTDVSTFKAWVDEVLGRESARHVEVMEWDQTAWQREEEDEMGEALFVWAFKRPNYPCPNDPGEKDLGKLIAKVQAEGSLRFIKTGESEYYVERVRSTANAS